jgi:hypothetical protein
MKRVFPAAFRAVCFSIGVMFSAASLDGDDLNFQPNSVTAQTIDSFLSTKRYRGKTSPMVGTGNSFVQRGLTYNIDPALIVAISGIETDFGLRTCTTDNAWNWFWQGPCPRSPFTSYDDGIKTVSKHLRLSYLNKGYKTIALIQKRYCTAPVENGVSCPGWISTVTQFRDELLYSSPVPPPHPGKYWWIAGGGILAAGSLGWLLGRRRKSDRIAVGR